VRVGHVLQRLSDWADLAVRILAVPIGIATVLIVFFEVLLRYVFQAPLVTSVELARLGFVWSCFLGAALGVKRGSHIRFVFFLEKCGPVAGGLLQLGVSVLCAAFFGFLILKGIEMTQRVYDTFFPALGFSQLWLYLPLPVSAAFMLVHGLAFVAKDAAALRSLPRKGAAQ
jgi:TRAP-type C4-dicarboxylate transport system permease small subunit